MRGCCHGSQAENWEDFADYLDFSESGDFADDDIQNGQRSLALPLTVPPVFQLL